MREGVSWRGRTVTVGIVLLTLVFAAGCSRQPAHTESQAGNTTKAGSSAPVVLPGAPGDKPEVATQAQLDKLSHQAKPSEASVHYVQMMVPHHQQALAMTALAEKRAANPQVCALAERIRDAQGAEIDMMQGWLQRHGYQQVAQSRAREMSDHHRSMMGMATRDQMARLKAASGGGFDRLFLELMTTHHQGAVDMGVDVLSRSEDPLVRSMAKDVIATQRDEIAIMEKLLAEIG